jgi:hypothetical protein
MKLWTSSEAMADIDEPLRLASKDVECVLNSSISTREYGPGVTQWDLIYIIMDEDDPNYNEVHRYKKKKHSIEFRLKVDHSAFKRGDSKTQRKLLASSVLRSIRIAETMYIDDFDCKRFLLDVEQTLEKNSWM